MSRELKKEPFALQASLQAYQSAHAPVGLALSEDAYLSEAANYTIKACLAEHHRTWFGLLRACFGGHLEGRRNIGRANTDRGGQHHELVFRSRWLIQDIRRTSPLDGGAVGSSIVVVGRT